MQHPDETLQTRVREAWPKPSRTPTFETAWTAAEQRRRAGRYKYGLGTAAAAIAAAVIVLLNSGAPEQERYVEVADLMDSTYWEAPSDALLPSREFDIYQDLPVLFESTEPAEGALL